MAKFKLVLNSAAQDLSLTSPFPGSKHLRPFKASHQIRSRCPRGFTSLTTPLWVYKMLAHQPLSWFGAPEAVPATVGSLPLCTIEWRKLVPSGRAASSGLGAVPGAARGFDRSTWL